MTKHKIVISCQEYARIVDINDIVYCQSDNGYTTLYLTDLQELLISKSLTKFATELDNSIFIRIHQSFLINANHIALVDKRNKIIKLKNETTVPFTVTIKKLLKNFKLDASNNI